MYEIIIHCAPPMDRGVVNEEYRLESSFIVDVDYFGNLKIFQS